MERKDFQSRAGNVRWTKHTARLVVTLCWAMNTVLGQPLGSADRDSPGDGMIQDYLRNETTRMSERLAADLLSRAGWESVRPRYVEEYFYMLGLSPRPEKTPLQATVTGTLEYRDCVVEMIHYQSRPGLYVTGNLYRPARVAAGTRLPAVFYVCGHSGRGRNGNKVAYQSHGIWLAQHGYVCLTVDTLQLGEIAAFHHGTYNLGRWWWHSRGYTPAGVEAWNGIRGIDYLLTRPDVDPDRIAVTGISGGGAATFWIASADERVKVAVPVSGMADLESYITNRVINGHCDCMFLYNTFQWPWTRIAALIAPRPLLFANSDQDPIFPMDANERVIQRLERLYGFYGCGDRVDAVVSVGGHAYRRDIREATYRFINAQLKGVSQAITDSEMDLVSEGPQPGAYPIRPEALRVFPGDADLPADQINTRVDELFVPVATVREPVPGQYLAWRQGLISELKRVSFGYFPGVMEAARKIANSDEREERLGSEPAIEFRLRQVLVTPDAEPPNGTLLGVLNEDEAGTVPGWIKEVASPGQRIVLCEPRGVGATRWTRRNPPNYVERAHVLLGRTVDAGRVWDVIAAAKHLMANPATSTGAGSRSVHVCGRGAAGVIAAYAAMLEDTVAGVTLVSPPSSHMAPGSPQFLNVLRVCDIPNALGLIAPRPLRLRSADRAAFQHTATAYAAASAADQLRWE